MVINENMGCSYDKPRFQLQQLPEVCSLFCLSGKLLQGSAGYLALQVLVYYDGESLKAREYHK